MIPPSVCACRAKNPFRLLNGWRNGEEPLSKVRHTVRRRENRKCEPFGAFKGVGGQYPSPCIFLSPSMISVHTLHEKDQSPFLFLLFRHGTALASRACFDPREKKKILLPSHGSLTDDEVRNGYGFYAAQLSWIPPKTL